MRRKLTGLVVMMAAFCAVSIACVFGQDSQNIAGNWLMGGVRMVMPAGAGRQVDVAIDGTGENLGPDAPNGLKFFVNPVAEGSQSRQATVPAGKAVRVRFTDLNDRFDFHYVLRARWVLSDEHRPIKVVEQGPDERKRLRNELKDRQKAALKSFRGCERKESRDQYSTARAEYLTPLGLSDAQLRAEVSQCSLEFKIEPDEIRAGDTIQVSCAVYRDKDQHRESGDSTLVTLSVMPLTFARWFKALHTGGIELQAPRETAHEPVQQTYASPAQCRLIVKFVGGIAPQDVGVVVADEAGRRVYDRIEPTMGNETIVSIPSGRVEISLHPNVVAQWETHRQSHDPSNGELVWKYYSRNAPAGGR